MGVTVVTVTVCFGIPMNSMQNGIASDENRTNALKGLFATQTPSGGGVGVQLAGEAESRRRPATGARNLNCMLILTAAESFICRSRRTDGLVGPFL